MADDDNPIDLDCIDLEKGSFTYFVFDGSKGCDKCQDHTAVTVCEPPECPHPSCGCDIVEKEFILPPGSEFRCELINVERDAEMGTVQPRSVHILSELPPEFEEYTNTQDDRPLDKWEEYRNSDGSYTFPITYVARLDKYESEGDDDDDEDDDGGGDDGEDGGEGGGEGGGGGSNDGVCEEPDLDTDEAASREASADCSFDLDDLHEKAFFEIEYQVSYIRYNINYQFYMVIKLGDEEYEFPIFQHTVHKYKSTGVLTNKVGIGYH